MPPSVVLTIRTANRAPQTNYLSATVANLLWQGVRPGQIHLFATDPDVSWLPVMDYGIKVHIPPRRLTPNENGIAQVLALDLVEADWIVMTEDDLEWCADPLGSIARWLDGHERDDVSIYRFFAFGPLANQGPNVAATQLTEQKGSQAVAMRAADARRFAAWALQHRTDWRPKGAPFQHRPHDGFDKLLGYWAMRDKGERIGLVSLPFFCRHVGVQSSIHSHGKRMDHLFAGANWSHQTRQSCPA